MLLKQPDAVGAHASQATHFTSMHEGHAKHCLSTDSAVAVAVDMVQCNGSIYPGQHHICVAPSR